MTIDDEFPVSGLVAAAVALLLFPVVSPVGEVFGLAASLASSPSFFGSSDLEGSSFFFSSSFFSSLLSSAFGSAADSGASSSFFSSFFASTPEFARFSLRPTEVGAAFVSGLDLAFSSSLFSFSSVSRSSSSTSFSTFSVLSYLNFKRNVRTCTIRKL